MFDARTLPDAIHIFNLECPREKNESQADYFDRFALWIAPKCELIQIRQIENAIIASLKDLKAEVEEQPTTITNIMSRGTFDRIVGDALRRHGLILEDTEKAIAADGGT